MGFALQRIEQPAVFAPNAFLRMGTDNIVTIISKRIEVGQGAYIGLATILADVPAYLVNSDSAGRPINGGPSRPANRFDLRSNQALADAAVDAA